MTTYYEFLQVSSTATVAEIEAAYEDRYNHWRRLVTHHDPEVVNRANQALRWLEKAHVTLTDPAKREAYDAGIGLRGPVGGLADLEAGSGDTGPPPGPDFGSQRAGASVTGQRVDAWVCPQCQAPNPLGTRFCNRCGQQLGIKCPKCGKLTQAAAPYCSECGVDIEGESRRRKAEHEAERRREERQRLQFHQAELHKQYAAVQALERIRQRFVMSPRSQDYPLQQRLWESVAHPITVGVELLTLTIIGIPIAYWLMRFSIRAEAEKQIQIRSKKIASLERQIERIQNHRR